MLGYYAAVLLFAHALAGASLLSGGSWSRPHSFVFANLAMLIPGLVAAAAARWSFREPLRQPLGASYSPDLVGLGQKRLAAYAKS